MLETLVQGNDWLAFIESLEKDRKSDSLLSNSSSPHEHEVHLEAWAKTDRPLRLPARVPLSATVPDSNSFAADDKTVLTRWLEEQDVRVELLDAGIGCCWCAYLGDDEPVCGESEKAALENLARANGV